MGRLSLCLLLGLTLLAVSLNDVHVKAEVGPTESECRPYIEKAIHELKTGDSDDGDENGDDSGQVDSGQTNEDSKEKNDDDDDNDDNDGVTSGENNSTETDTKENDNNSGENDDDTASSEHNDKEDSKVETAEGDDDDDDSKENDQKHDDDNDDNDDENDGKDSGEKDTVEDSKEDSKDSGENETKTTDDNDSDEDNKDSNDKDDDNDSDNDDDNDTKENDDTTKSGEDNDENSKEAADDNDTNEANDDDDDDDHHDNKEVKDDTTEDDSKENDTEEDDNKDDSKEETDEVSETIRKKRSADLEALDDNDDDDDSKADSKEDKKSDENDVDDNDSHEEVAKTGSDEDNKSDDDKADDGTDDDDDSKENDATKEESSEDNKSDVKADDDDEDSKEKTGDDDDDNSSKAVSSEDNKSDVDADDEGDSKEDDTKVNSSDAKQSEDDDDSEEETHPEDDLLLEEEIPENLRDRKHINELLHLDEEFDKSENAQDRVAEIILRDIKRIHENAIKPLETLYKYRDLSNRHFGDPEIFSKPLVLFMGPWSGGKSSIINYLTDNEFKSSSLRTGAEPSPAYFNILMWGNETEVLDGTQLAADWTFSGLQKFGQGLEDRLRGLKMPSKLLEKVNIVEIPGILEVRKQVSRLFPFNDACQWFIDRADIIVLVYDPAKLDAGPETEAILDQLKGREYQTRILLNKADTIKPEELLRVQSALIWNISPLMSSAQPPAMYTTSLWSRPYDSNSPIRLLQAQERGFLRDLRTAIDKRIENRIASARRFAVRVRNHAKMVDCYLNTYYNHKTIFGNKKRIADEIIQNPQNYHIYEGLSTLTNISRYDLPDPEVYRDFFRLNPLYEFKKLSQTCTYFRGCPINKLDVAIAYDLPELGGKYKKMAEQALANLDSTHQETTPTTNNNKS